MTSKTYTLIIAAAMLLCSHLQAAAATRTIKVSQITGELTQALRKATADLTAADKAVIQFDKAGTYTLKGTVGMKCSATITGMGRDNTTIVLDKGTDRTGFKAFTDIYFLAFYGYPSQPIQVEISDLTFKLREHTGIWWKTDPRHAIEIMHANKVTVTRVASYLQDAVITNMDLRNCSNVTITDCIFSNYNNCNASGNLWLRGESKNVTITGNKFCKYGNDESLAIFGSDANAHTHATRPLLPKHNITVSGNEFNYGGYKSKTIDNSVVCDVLIAIFGDDAKPNTSGSFADVHFDNNVVNVTAPLKRVFMANFNQADEHSNFTISGNTINNNASSDDDLNYYKMDFMLIDRSSGNEPLQLVGNKVLTRHIPTGSSGSSKYTHLIANGGSYLLSGNTVRCTPSAGMTLLWPDKNGAHFTLRDNHYSGMAYLALFSRDNDIAASSITASGNTFQGSTGIYCKNVASLDLDFDQNTFNSTSGMWFLNDFAATGSLSFTSNQVTVATRNGKLMQHSSSKSLGSMRFGTLTVTGNTFVGVSKSNLLANISNIGKKTVHSNSYR